MFDQLAIDRITESENLTDNLDDDSANWLINWGIESARKLIASSTDKEMADVTINRLMAVMRKLNKITANLQNVQIAELQSLTESYQNAFGLTTKHNDDQYQVITSELQKMTPLDAIKYLLNFASDKPQSTETNQRRGCGSMLTSLFSLKKD
jgi:hypothetical protein